MQNKIVRFLRDEWAILALLGAAIVQTWMAVDAMSGVVKSKVTVSFAQPVVAMVSHPVHPGAGKA